MTLAGRVFPNFVATEETFDFPGLEALFAEERKQVANAVAVRQAEFAAGRTCARLALSRLGIPPVPIVAGADRLPIWPQGITGSISHTAAYCGVAVCRANDAQAIGFDAEPEEPLDPELIDTVCLPAERAWLEAQCESQRGALAKLFFSAKECVFKSQFPTTRTYLEFHDVALSFDLTAGTFTAAVKSLPSQVTGNFLVAQGLILTGVVLSRLDA